MFQCALQDPQAFLWDPLGSHFCCLGCPWAANMESDWVQKTLNGYGFFPLDSWLEKYFLLDARLVSKIVMASLWHRFGINLVSFCDHFGNILGSFWVPAREVR